LDKGYKQNEIASILMLDEDTISNWIKKFQVSSTLKQWLKNNYSAYNGKLNQNELSQVKHYVRENIITDVKQVICYVEEQFHQSYSQSGMRHLLHSLGFSYKQLCLFPTKADITEQEQFVTEYTDLKNNLSAREDIVFIDGVHPQHNAKSSQAWIQKGTEKYIRTNTGRQRININGAYNPNNQDVIVREDDTINAQSTIELFKQIERKYATDECIYAIADNARYYRSCLVKEFLKTSKIKLIFLPPYSPNLNLIERLWKFLRKKVINTIYYPDFSSFKLAIDNFFNNIGAYKQEIKQFIGDKFHLFNINPKTTLA
jgi:transposase